MTLLQNHQELLSGNNFNHKNLYLFDNVNMLKI